MEPRCLRAPSSPFLQEASEDAASLTLFSTTAGDSETIRGCMGQMLALEPSGPQWLMSYIGVRQSPFASVSPVLLIPLPAAQESLVVPKPAVIHGVSLVCNLKPCVG